jgi:nucleoside-diphosphate-sugar epimerase
MKTILVTGSEGFMGRHLCLALRRQGGCEVLEFDVRHAPENLPVLAARAGFPSGRRKPAERGKRIHRRQCQPDPAPV